jgi:hypothetical protein
MMQSAECRTFAEQCSQLANKLTGDEHDFLLEMADKWRQAAVELDAHESAKGEPATR